MRIARTVTGRNGTVVMDYAYHGNSKLVGEMSTGTYPADQRPPYIQGVAPPNTYRGVYQQGREDNLLWERTVDGIQPAGALTLAAGDTYAMDRDDIHTAFNPSQSLTGAIHIYEGDFLTTPKREWDPVTHKERPRIMAETFGKFKSLED